MPRPKNLRPKNHEIVLKFSEYLIPIGTPDPDGSCKFTYRSMSRKEGRFNSPRHPSNYPSSTNCTYWFFAMPDEQVSNQIGLVFAGFGQF